MGWGDEQRPQFVMSTGGRYDPVARTWSPISANAAPSARFAYPLQALWTGREIIIWGGADSVSPGNSVNTGKRYDPACDCWLDMTQTGAPGPRFNMGFVWTGQSVIVPGGSSYNASYTDTFFYTPPRGD